MIKKAIILAAGKSERMGALTHDRPKCLLEVCGKPIIRYQIEGLRAAGVEDIVMVVGYKKKRIIETLGQDIRYRIYDDFALTNNLHTLWNVADELDRACLITFADVICSSSSLKKMAAASDNLFTLLVDTREVRPNTMRVLLRGPFVYGIGSHITTHEGDGNFLGIAAVNKEGTDILKPQLAYMATSAGAGYESDYWVAAINALSRSGILISVLRINDPWFEIDTPEDLALAQSMFAVSAQTA